MRSIPLKLKPIPVVIALQAVLCSPLWAASFDVATGTTVTTPQAIDAAGQTASVAAGGTLTVSGDKKKIAIKVTANSGTVSIDNSGTIAQTETGRAIDITEKSVTVLINNNEGGLITTAGNDVIRGDNKAAIIQVNNQGTIWQKGAGMLEGGQALDFKSLTSSGNSIINGSATNKNALIRADGDDAIRAGSNTVIENYGTIISTGIVNTSCPSYLEKDSKCALNDEGEPYGAADGIDAKKNTNVMINNHGLIIGSRHAITADVGITVNNDVDGQIIGNNGSGIGSDGTGTVTNYGLISGRYAGEGKVYDHVAGTSYSGTITTSSNGDGDGVDIDGIATITNYGRIEGLGGGGVDSGERPNGGDGVAMGGGLVINVQGASIWGDSNGILVDDGANGKAVASGRGTDAAAAGIATIENSGDITGNKKVAIGLVGNFDDQIVNTETGRIIGGANTVLVNEIDSTTAGAAIQMGDGNDVLFNSGYIEGKNGLAIDMGDGDDTLSLLGGKVVGSINGGSGTNTLITAGTQYFAANTLSNFQNFNVLTGSNTTFDFALGQVNTITVAENGHLRVNGAFGAVDLTVNGTLQAPTTSALRTIQVSGNYTQATTGVLETRLNSQGSDQLLVTGSASFADGATIRTLANGYIEDGTTYTLVSANNGNLSAAVDKLIIDSSSSALTYTLQNVNGTLQLVAHRSQSATSGVSSSFVSMLKPIFNSNTQAGVQLMNALESLPNAEASRKASAQLAPETNARAQTAAMQSQGAVFSAIASHVDAMRSDDSVAMAESGMAAGDNASGRFWMKGVAAWAKQRERKESNGYDIDLQGVALGHETDINATDMVGISGGYTQTNSDGTGEGAGDGNNIKSGHIGTYFSRTKANYTLDASAILSFNRYHSSRLVTMPGFEEALSAKYSGKQFGVQVEYGIPFVVSENARGRWLVGTQLSRLNNDSYQEAGGVTAQRINRSHTNSVKSVIGAELTNKLNDFSSLSVRARYLHEFENASTINASYVTGGQSFSIDGADAARDTLQLGTSYRYVSTRGVTFTFGYDLDIKDRYLGHQLSAKTMWNF